MAKSRYKPFGTWISSISVADVAENAPKLNEPSLHDGWLYWLQSIADEQGRMSLFCKKNSQTNNTELLTTSILASPFNIRSKVHEYGGKSYCIAEQTLYFVNANDQQIYSAKIHYPDKHQNDDGKNSSYDREFPTLSEPKALTQTPDTRYGELSFNAQHRLLICIAETHYPDSSHHIEAKNFVAGIQVCDNSKPHSVLVLAQGRDFYAYPKISPNGKYLSYIAWNHPNLPWDKTSLHISLIGYFEESSGHKSDGDDFEYLELESKELLVEQGSLLQPNWSNNGDFFYISDCDNWWNIYSIDAKDIDTLHKKTVTATQRYEPITKQITKMQAEFATPLWTLGMSTYIFLDDTTLLATYTQHGVWFLCLVDTQTQTIRIIESEASTFRDLDMGPQSTEACFIVSSPITNEHVVSITKTELDAISRKEANFDDYLAPDTSIQKFHLNNISIGRNFSFVSNEREINAFFYPPKNTSYDEISSQQKPPVIVICHGGPTGQTNNAFNLKIQFWTSRGFSVIDVNYTGSTGYGREFRHLLYGNWGIYEVEDLANAAQYAAKKGWINKDQKIIKGSSAGGYSVLASLAFTKTFDAGVCLYGIGDLELLAKDTHKFEARYLDQLIGPYPEEKELYKKRSPIYSTEHLNCPLLIFQGLEDKVVPPNQAYSMAEALRQKNLPMALVEYPDEGHGFRNPKNIQHMMASELFFYQKVFSLIDEAQEASQEASNVAAKAPITIENI